MKRKDGRRIGLRRWLLQLSVPAISFGSRPLLEPGSHQPQERRRQHFGPETRPLSSANREAEIKQRAGRCVVLIIMVVGHTYNSNKMEGGGRDERHLGDNLDQRWRRQASWGWGAVFAPAVQQSCGVGSWCQRWHGGSITVHSLYAHCTSTVQERL